MRILHVSQRFWPSRGGAEKHIAEISCRLAAEGHRVTVATTDAHDFELLYTPHRRRVERREETYNGILIRRFPVRHLPGAPLTYAAWRRMLRLLSRLHPIPVGVLDALSRFTPWVPDLDRWLKATDEAFDLVGAANITFESMPRAGLRFARQRGIPFVMFPFAHLGAGPKPGQDHVSSFYTMRHQLSLIRDSDAVAAQTPTAGDFWEEHGVPRDRIHVIGSGVNPDEILGGNAQRFREQHNVRGPLVAYVGAMAYDKGAISLAEAIRRLWRDGREVELALAGAVLAQFRQYLDGLPPADRERIHVLGSIGEAEKRDLLAATDIVSMASRTDSFGILYLEAWLYRKPVIGARAWGVNDVIEDGRDGLLVPFGDVPVLAEAVARLLDDPAMRNALGQQGEQKVYRSLTWKKKYAMVKKLYEQLVEDGAP